MAQNNEGGKPPRRTKKISANKRDANAPEPVVETSALKKDDTATTVGDINAANPAPASAAAPEPVITATAPSVVETPAAKAVSPDPAITAATTPVTEVPSLKATPEPLDLRTAAINNAIEKNAGVLEAQRLAEEHAATAAAKKAEANAARASAERLIRDEEAAARNRIELQAAEDLRKVGASPKTSATVDAAATATESAASKAATGGTDPKVSQQVREALEETAQNTAKTATKRPWWKFGGKAAAAEAAAGGAAVGAAATVAAKSGGGLRGAAGAAVDAATWAPRKAAGLLTGASGAIMKSRVGAFLLTGTLMIGAGFGIKSWADHRDQRKEQEALAAVPEAVALKQAIIENQARRQQVIETLGANNLQGGNFREAVRGGGVGQSASNPGDTMSSPSV
jgi:hypothetical protein